MHLPEGRSAGRHYPHRAALAAAAVAAAVAAAAAAAVTVSVVAALWRPGPRAAGRPGQTGVPLVGPAGLRGLERVARYGRVVREDHSTATARPQRAAGTAGVRQGTDWVRLATVEL